MNAREVILGRVRSALADVEESRAAVDVPIDWRYGRALPTADVVEDFIEKVEDYKAVVDRVTPDQVETAIEAAVARLGSARVVAPEGIAPEWLAALERAGVEVRRDDPPLTHAELNETDTVITTCAVAMADSGTIALDHGVGQGRRALTLLPDRHLCVVRADQVVSDVPEGVAALAPAIRAGQPVTWLSGGSATSDIELSRVEGVHGPRTLHVLLVAE